MGAPSAILATVPPPNPIPETRLKKRQQAALKAVFGGLHRGVTKQLVQLPTGVGKTILGAHITLRFARPLFLVHREELLAQTVQTYSRVVPNESVGLIYDAAHEMDGRITVGMIQTVHKRLDRIPPEAFDIVVMDECHHAAATTWRAVAEHFRPALRLGLSATPERHDGAPLNDIFSEIVYEMNLAEAIEEGLLVRPKALQVKTQISLDKIKVVAGDFQASQLSQAINTAPRNELIVDTYLAHATGRKALAFCADIQHAKDLAKAFRDRDIPADFVSGEDSKRAKKIEAFAKGHLRVLTNAYCLTEGFDDPNVSAILIARPLYSRPLYAQILGRGLRLAEGKEDCIVLDFMDASSKHALLSAWKFFGRPDYQPKEPTDVFDNPMTVADAAVARLEAVVGLTPNRDQVQALVHEIDLLLPPPAPVVHFSDGTQPWMLQEPTERQLAILEANGFNPTGWTRGQAALTIAKLPPAPKQALLLLAYGFDVLTKDWNLSMAQTALNQAKAEGRTPDWSRVNQLIPAAWSQV